MSRRSSSAVLLACAATVLLAGCGGSSAKSAAQKQSEVTTPAGSGGTSRPTVGGAGASSASGGSGSSAPATSGPLSGGATNSGSAAASSGGAPKATSGNPAPSGPNPASQATLSRIVLQPADLSGWTSSAHQSEPGDSDVDAKLAACTGTRNTDPDRYATSYSEDFTKGLAQIGSVASSYRSTADLTSDRAKLASPKIVPCVIQLVEDEAASKLNGAKVTNPKLAIALHPSGYAGNVEAIGSGSFMVSGLKAFVTIAFITGPRIESELTFVSPGVPVTASTVASAIKAVAARAAAA